MSMRLLLATESEPMPTGIPAASIGRSGATPWPNLALDAGQCATEQHQIGLLRLERAESLLELAHCCIALGRIGCEDLLVHDSPHTKRHHRLHHDAAGAGVGVGGDARLESLDYAEFCRIEELCVVENLVAALAELVDPIGEVEILEETAHRGELEMRVRVDQSGQENRVAQIVIFTGG